MIRIKVKVIEDHPIVKKVIIVWKISIRITALKETKMEDLEDQGRGRQEKIQTLFKVLNQMTKNGSHGVPPLIILIKILNHKEVV